MKLRGIVLLITISAFAAWPVGAFAKAPKTSVVFTQDSVNKGNFEQKGGKFETYKGYPGWGSTSGESNDHDSLAAPGLVSRIPADNGSLVVWCYFKGFVDNLAERHGMPPYYYPVLAFFDNNGKILLDLWVAPTYKDNPEISALSIGGDYDNGARYVYGQHMPGSKKIPLNRWFSIGMTWGPNPQKDNRLYLDGEEVSAYLEGFNETDLVQKSVRLSSFLSRASKVVIGSDPTGPSSFRQGIIGEIQVYDEILTSFKFPPRGLPTIKSFSDDSFRIPGISGKLVAGDKVHLAMEGDPGGKAWVDFGDVKGVPLAEDPKSPGKYTGEFVVPPGIFFENGKMLAYLKDVSGLESEPFVGQRTVSIDSRTRFAMTIDKTDLPADSSSTARVKVKVTDANGNPVKDHQVKVTLSTTDEYTGLVGGGSARYRDAAAAAKDLLAGADVETRWKGITDSWGEVEFDFKSGFAAKTIILQAKDMTTGDVGVDYITSYKEASIDIVLTPPISRAAARRGLQYIIKVEATRTELTADGRSRSVIRATVQDPTGKPVAGDTVVFSLSSANGTLNTIKGTTDASGVATAEYIAGKKIGIVVVSATDTVRNVSGSVSITLLADAPAKIILKARPETLPADGNSRSDIGVKVTDINDNPNADTKVEFRLARGTGRLDAAERVTDRFGDAANRFLAGTTPGIATIVATVRSKVPTEAELANARNVLFVPYSDAGEEIRISQWLKRKGDTARKGEPIVEYTFGRSDTKYTLNAPYDCRIDFQYVEYWDNAKTGDTLARITPVVIPGSTNPLPAQPAMAPRRR